MEATQGLLQAWEWCGKQPVARTLHLKALKKEAKLRCCSFKHADAIDVLVAYSF